MIALPIRNLAAAAVALACSASVTRGAAPPDTIVVQRAELAARLAVDLEKLAAWCDKRQLREQAAASREWVRSRDPGKLYLVNLSSPPDAPAAKEASADATAGDDVAEWTRRLAAMRKEHADDLFQLALQAGRAKRWSLALELVLETVRDDPDHEAARRLLGYERYRGGWHTPFEVQKLKGGFVWHADFGWLAADDVEKYERGQRPLGKRWIDADEDARRHNRIESGWKIQTEHYLVTTNYSLEAGVQLGVRLEELYRAWQLIFVRFYASDAQLTQLFQGKTKPGKGMRRHSVLYFRNREEYQAALQGELPPGVETSGIYLGKHDTAYFFADDNADDFSTLDHEATHQLFNETRRVVRDIGEDSNFWIVEGVACYMESFQRHGDYQTLGGRDAVRFQNAYVRLVDDEFYIPLADLCTWGRRRLQTDERIAKVYSQSAGLTHFLMHDAEGRYRDALIEYLVAVYTGQAKAGTLADAAGVPLGELDRQYREWMTQAPNPQAPAP